MIEPTWPGAEVEILSNATVRLQSTSAYGLTNNLVVRDGGIIKGHTAVGGYTSYDSVRIEGRVYLHRYPGSSSGNNAWHGVFRDGAVPGRLVYTGASAGRLTDFRGANTYTGGTEIEDGGAGAAAFLLFGAGRMPDTGDILIHTNGVMDFNGITDTVGSLAGVGTVLLGGATVTAAEGVSPGTNSLMAGTLRIEENGALVLGALSASTFHLGPVAGPSDRVLIVAAGGNLTLNGTLNIVDLGDMDAGDYTLFDLNGGTVGGAFTATNMPEPFLGSVAVTGGDVVLTVTRKPPAGTLMLIR